MLKVVPGIEDPRSYPLYRYLDLFARLDGFKAASEEEKAENGALTKAPHDYANLTEDDKAAMKCDEIFSLYLREVAQTVRQSVYSTILKFVLLFRECLNEYGWEKRKENDPEGAKKNPRKENVEFCSENNAEHAPEICNELVTVFLEQKKDSDLQRTESIDFTRHFCHWLFIKGYTCSKLSMIN